MPVAQKFLATLAVSLLTTASFASAQSLSNEQETSSVAGADLERVLPEVEVRGFGLKSWVRGLNAYQQGDFELAEKEFKVTRNVTARSVLSSSFAGDGSTIGGLASLSQAPLSIRGGSADIPGSLTSTSLNFDSRDEHSMVSYAVGASLIKQGKYAEAKPYFSSAVGYDRNNHDARMRLGLIHLLEGDTQKAERRLRQLTRYCDALDCTGEDSLSVSVRTLTSAIEAARATDVALAEE